MRIAFIVLAACILAVYSSPPPAERLDRKTRLLRTGQMPRLDSSYRIGLHRSNSVHSTDSTDSNAAQRKWKISFCLSNVFQSSYLLLSFSFFSLSMIRTGGTSFVTVQGDPERGPQGNPQPHIGATGKQ